MTAQSVCAKLQQSFARYLAALQLLTTALRCQMERKISPVPHVCSPASLLPKCVRTSSSLSHSALPEQQGRQQGLTDTSAHLSSERPCCSVANACDHKKKVVRLAQATHSLVVSVFSQSGDGGGGSSEKGIIKTSCFCLLGVVESGQFTRASTNTSTIKQVFSVDNKASESFTCEPLVDRKHGSWTGTTLMRSQGF